MSTESATSGEGEGVEVQREISEIVQTEVATFRGEIERLDQYIAKETDILRRLEGLPVYLGTESARQEGIIDSKQRMAGLLAYRETVEDYLSQLELSDHKLKTLIFGGNTDSQIIS